MYEKFIVDTMILLFSPETTWQFCRQLIERESEDIIFQGEVTDRIAG